MSHQAVTWALSQPIKPSPAKFILVVLAHHVRASDAPPWRAFASVSELVEATGQDRKTVMANVARLVESGWLHDTGERTGPTKSKPVYELREGSSGTKYGTPKQSQISHEAVPETVPPSSTENGTPSSAEAVPDFPGSGTGFPTKQSQISHEAVPETVPLYIEEEKKEEIQEEKKKKTARPAPSDVFGHDLPDWLPLDEWAMFDRFRKAKSAKAWTADAQRLSLRTLGRLRDAGNDPAAVLARSVERGWTGLFPLADQQQRPAAGARMSRQEQAEAEHQRFLQMTGGGVPDDGLTLEADHAAQR